MRSSTSALLFPAIAPRKFSQDHEVFLRFLFKGIKHCGTVMCRTVHIQAERNQRIRCTGSAGELVLYQMVDIGCVKPREYGKSSIFDLPPFDGKGLPVAWDPGGSP